MNDAQTTLYLYQREKMAHARSTSPGLERPIGPTLAPLGSPGPVTPLELEGDEGYLMAGMRSASKDAMQNPAELVDRLISEESRRRRSGQSPTSS